MTLLASPLIDWSALWKIVLAALLGGAGVVILFGILLLGIKMAHGADNPAQRVGAWALSGLCGLICIGAVVVGIYAMTQKPASKSSPPPSKSKSAAVLAPPGADKILVASVS